jgi:Arc-like DNA binding dprotein
MAKRSDKALVAVTLRIREHLRKQLQEAAKKKGVSLNSEMAFRLEQTFEDEKDLELVRKATELAWNKQMKALSEYFRAKTEEDFKEFLVQVKNVHMNEDDS